LARQVVTQYVSDLNGKELDDKSAVEIRIKWPADSRKGSVVLDASETEVANLIKAGRKEKARGRAASKK
jgi:hypothetical protein